MEKTRSKRNGTLEFWRFVFCVFILLFHAGKYVFGQPSTQHGVFFAFFPHGSIGVEFFFLLTGLFLAMSAEKQCKRQPEGYSLGDETVRYVWKKYCSIFPYHLIAFITLFVITLSMDTYDWFHALLLFINSIPGLFLVQMSGVPSVNLNHVEWYLSVMMIAIAIVYPLCRRYYDAFTRIVAPVGGLMILGYLGVTCNRLTGITNWEGHFYRGFLRGLAEILIGAFCYAFVKNYLAPLREKIGGFRRLLLTLLEWVSYTVVIFFAIMTFPPQYEFAALFFIFVAVSLSFSDLTYSGALLNNPVSMFLGRFSLVVYLTQVAAIKIATQLLVDLDDSGKVWAIVILTLIFSIVTLIAGDICMKLSGSRKKQPPELPMPPAASTGIPADAPQEAASDNQ